jgi:hypothetical protein
VSSQRNQPHLLDDGRQVQDQVFSSFCRAKHLLLLLLLLLVVVVTGELQAPPGVLACRLHQLTQPQHTAREGGHGMHQHP